MEKLITISNTGRLLESDCWSLPIFFLINLRIMLSDRCCVRGRHIIDITVHFRSPYFYLLLLRLVCVCVGGRHKALNYLLMIINLYCLKKDQQGGETPSLMLPLFLQCPLKELVWGREVREADHTPVVGSVRHVLVSSFT